MTEITVSDDSAKIVQNFNNAGAAVSGAGEKGDTGLTAEQLELLTLYASSEGRNIPISEDGEIITQVGHTYTITAGEQAVKCTDADFNPLCEVAAHKQVGFVAPATAAYVDPVTCTVTEVFRAAAPVELSGNGGGEPEGDYVTLDANGVITSGRLDTLVDGSNLQHNKTALTSWEIGLPALSQGVNMFANCRLDKNSVIALVDSLPTYESGLHVLGLGIQNEYETDAEVLAAIADGEAKGWAMRVNWVHTEELPDGYTALEYLELTGTQYVETNVALTNKHGAEIEWVKTNTDNEDRPIFGSRAFARPPWLAPYMLGSVFSTQFGDYHVTVSEPAPKRNQRYITSLNFLNSCKAFVDDTEIGSFNEDAFSASYVEYTYSAMLGCCGYQFGSSKHIGLIYRARVSYGGDIIRHYVPCLDETGAPCMFDLIEQKPYYNDGTGDFLYPSQSATYALRRVIPDWGKLTEHGLRRLYHAPANHKGELIDYALENGYKPIVEPEKPEEGYWTPQWRETEDEIILDWIETEAPEMEEQLFPLETLLTDNN
jgi:hypothetical protein